MDISKWKLYHSIMLECSLLNEKPFENEDFEDFCKRKAPLELRDEVFVIMESQIDK